MSLMYLIGTEIDYVEGLQGAGFKFHNPNVKSTCGCGSSFSSEPTTRARRCVARFEIAPCIRLAHCARVSDIVGLLERELGADRHRRPGARRGFDDYCRDESPLPVSYPPEPAQCCAQTTDEVSAVLRICAEQAACRSPRAAPAAACAAARWPVAAAWCCRPSCLQPHRRGRRRRPGGGGRAGRGHRRAGRGRASSACSTRPIRRRSSMCSIGGNAATNAGGPRAFKYGVTREYVLGLEVALMGGERAAGRPPHLQGRDRLRPGGRLRRQRGHVRRHHRADREAAAAPGSPGDRAGGLRRRADGRCVHQRAAAAAACARAVLELADRASIEHIRGRSRYRFPTEAGAYRADRARRRRRRSLDGPGRARGVECERARRARRDDGRPGPIARALWEARRQISGGAQGRATASRSTRTCACRAAKIVEMLARIDRVAAAHQRADRGVRPRRRRQPARQHAVERRSRRRGGARAHARWRQRQELFAHTVELRGTLSGEHGIGLSKRDFMPIEQGERVLEWQRRWKAMWDPAGLLNPGKVLPPSTRRCSE
jgi:glycolate oxidase